MRLPSRASAAAVLVALAVLAGCGDDTVTREQFAKELHSATEGPDQISEADARCIADASFEQFSQDQVDDLYKSTKAEDIPKEVLDQWKDIVAECTKDG